MSRDTLRFGILSTASVNDYSFYPHIGKTPGATLHAIASRDAGRAREVAKKRRIPKSYGDYQALLDDPEVDCVYISLPASMHKEWSIHALQAGKHVLCEKPVAANAAQARQIDAVVKSSSLTFMEAFHYRYHPLAARIEEIIRSGGIGELRHIFVQTGFKLPDRDKVQFKPELAGGALLDIGCYCVNFARWIADCDDARVTSAQAKITPSGVDGAIRATLEFGNGVTAEARGSLVETLPPFAHIRGSRGELLVLTPFMPSLPSGPIHLDLYLLLMRKGLKIQSVRVPPRITYQCQLQAFCESVRAGTTPSTGAEAAVGGMSIIDAIYEKAGVTHTINY